MKVQEGEKEKCGVGKKKMFEGIMEEYVPILVKDINLQIQEAKKLPNPKRSTYSN